MAYTGKDPIFDSVATSNASTGLTISSATIAADGSSGNISLFVTPKGTGGAVVSTNLTVGNVAQDVNYTVNGAAITAIISAEADGASDLGGIISHRHSDTAAFGGHTLYLRTRNTGAAPTIVQNGDTLSIISSAGYDGTDYAQAAQIQVQVDGAPGANDMPGRMIFYTSPDGSQTPTEALRISSTQLSTFSGDVTVTRSNSGGTVLETISNSSDTVSSNAELLIQVAGTSANDAFINYSVSGSTQWSEGLDNSDSDKFKISQSSTLGTNDSIVITTAGEVTMPKQPAFAAFLSASTTNDVTGDGTVYTIICNTENYDQGSNYNAGTGTFTSPTAGIYLYTLYVTLQNLNVVHTSGYCHCSGSIDARGEMANVGVIQNAGNSCTLVFSNVISTAAGNTVNSKVTVSGGTKTVGITGGLDGDGAPYTYFTATLLC